MNQLIKKIIIFIIVILMIVGILAVTSIAYTYNNMDRNKIIGIEWTTGPEVFRIKEYDVSKDKEVVVLQRTTSHGDNYVSILNQPNVWCVEHGVELSAGTYSVGQEVQVTNNVLAYILNHGPSMGSLPDSTISPAQVALWQYLYENPNDPDVKKMTEGINTLKQPQAGDPGISEQLLNDGLALLQAAKEYANNLGNSAPSLSLSLNGDYLNITVGGSLSKYKIYINDVQYTAGSTNGIYTKDVNANRTISVLAESIGAGEAKVRIEALTTKYTAAYRLLKNADQQNLIVVTNASSKDEVTGTIEKTQPLYTNVSLQKYITKVNDENLSSDETNLVDRKNTYSTINETDADAKKHPSRTEQATNQYKRENSVYIEAGDTVTYRIYVYNNSNITAKSVDVRDKLLYYGNTQYRNYEIISITRDGNRRDIKNEWKYVNNTTTHEYQYTIENLAGNSSTYFDVTVRLSTYIENQIIDNTAYISSTTPDNKDDYRTVDRDYIQMRPYQVSLQKIVYSVNNNTSGISSFDRWESWESNANVNNNPVNETYNRDNRYAKHNNPVTVANGDTVTYAIKVRNDGDTRVNITQIVDTLPEGVSLQEVTNESGNRVSYVENGQQITITEHTGLLNKNQERIPRTCAQPCYPLFLLPETRIQPGFCR